MILTFRYLPKRVSAITLWPFILVKTKELKQDKYLINHERIHLAQQKELLVLPFYLIYLIEGLLKGYMKISFEKEAYGNEDNLNYLKTRKHYASFKRNKSRN